jgi:hypothetical protein
LSRGKQLTYKITKKQVKKSNLKNITKMTFVKLPVSDTIINLDRIAFITDIMNINAHNKHLEPKLRYEVIFFNHNAMGTKNIYIKEEDYQLLRLRF